MKDKQPKLTDFTPNTLLVDLGGRKAYRYFGVVVYVPKECKWLAMDSNGNLYGYTHKPEKQERSFTMKEGTTFASIQDFSSITSTDWLEYNWFNSRIKVKHLSRVRCFAP